MVRTQHSFASNLRLMSGPVTGLMEAKMWQRILVIGVAVVALAGCDGVYTQTTSGETYLQKYEIDGGLPGRAMDDAVRASAAVEPLLVFPARIGIARISRGGLTPL